jgi:hypothetical protein
LLGGAPSAFPEEVSVLYDGRQIKNLRKINITVWSSGNETIKHQDIVRQLEITLTRRARLLKATVLKASSPANEVVVSHDGGANPVKVDFLFLEPRQGFNVELLHTGREAVARIDGVVMGIPKGIKKVGEPQERRPFWLNLVVNAMPAGLVAFYIYVVELSIGPELLRFGRWAF